MESECIFYFMRFTHRHSVADNIHWFIKYKNRNLKYRIAFRIYWQIFFSIHYHIIIIRAVPLYGCHRFFAFVPPDTLSVYRCE